MPGCLLLYSSVTGNTRMIAEAMVRELPPDTVLAPIREAPLPTDFDLVIIGFWVHRGGPDPRTIRYMETVRHRDVAFFGTLAAYPDSDHARGVLAKAEQLLAHNRIVGSFLCQGKLAPKRLAERLRGDFVDARHPMTDERRARLLEAASHPDARDLRMAREAAQRFWLRHVANKNA